MSIADSMANLRAEIEEFTSQISGDYSNTVNYPALIDNADNMKGILASQIIEELSARALKHINTKGVNVHKTTATQLGSYTKEEFDDRLDSLLDKNSESPLSFYGDREYLPPTVTGSFESGVNWAPYGSVGMFLEDNGTLMMLRTGSDGVTAGVYYAYLRNALNTSLITEIVMTNARYAPAYFPSTMQAAAILYANRDLIIGMLVDKVTMQQSGFFVSLTNDTYDMSKHTGIVIPLNNIIKLRDNSRHVYGLPLGYMKGDKVYILTNMDYDKQDIGGYKVYSIAKNDLITGVYNGATPITGWTINRGVKGVVQRTHLEYCDDPTKHMVMLDPRTYAHDGNYVGGHPHDVRRNPANDKIDFVAFTHVWPSIEPSIFQYLVVTQQWAFEIPDNRVIDVAKYYNDPPTYDVNDTDTGWKVVSGIQAVPPHGWYTSFANQHNVTRTCFTDNNYVFTYNTYDLYTQRYLGRYKYPENATYLQIMGMEAVAQSAFAQLYEGRYASPVTFLFGSVTNYGDLVLTAHNKGWNKQNKVEFMSFRASTVGQPDFAYGSLGGMNLKGYIPTGDRKWVDDLPSNTKEVRNTVNETDASGWRVSAARWDNIYFPDGVRWGNIDTNLNGSDLLSASNGVTASLKAQVQARFAALGLPAQNWQGGDNSTWVELVVPQRYTDMPAFVHGHHIANDRWAYYFIARVNITGSRKAITGVTLDAASLVYKQSITSGPRSFFVGSGDLNGCGGQIAIRRVSGGFAIGVSTIDRFSYYGNSTATVALITYNGQFAFVGDKINYDQHTISISNWLNYPSHGLLYSVSSETHRWVLDCGTKLVGVQACTDQFPTVPIDQLMARIGDPAYSKVYLSQQTVTAWTVYFADPTPAMVNGRYYEMPIYAHTLDPATAKNRTFYVWVVKQRDTEYLDYYITTSTAVPVGVEGSLYIGYFTTDGNGLNKVAVAKRIAVADMLLAPTQQGSGIPLTSGIPATYGRFNWR